LWRLVEQLSEDRVPAVLAEARRQSESVPAGEMAAAVVRIVRQRPLRPPQQSRGSPRRRLRTFLSDCLHTGPLMAAADRDDQHNRACTDLITGLHLARRAILVPAPAVAEVGYLLGRAGGAKIEAAFSRSIVQETLTVADLELVDYQRMAELVEVYVDFPLDTTDAAC